MKTNQTSRPLRKERTGVDRLYKFTGRKKVSFYYQYPNGTSETYATAPIGNKNAINEAERIAKRRALDVQQGKIIAGSMADLIDRFQTQEDRDHFLDQSRDGIAARKGEYANLTKFFGRMNPKALKTSHGYQYLEARAKAGAPIKANKELALMSTICKKAIRWGIIESNPFTDMELNKADKCVRTIKRSHVVEFYLWCQREESAQFKTLGCAALFTYLTGFRAAEVRPFHVSGLTRAGVQVVGAKRKKGEFEVVKLREWSAKLRMVVKRAQQAHEFERTYLFSNRHGKAYTRSGWGTVWQKAMLAFIGCAPKELVKHPKYFSLLDVRPAAISKKLDQRSKDTYDFAAHANPATTHRDYDRRRVKRATATE